MDFPLKDNAASKSAIHNLLPVLLFCFLLIPQSGSKQAGELSQPVALERTNKQQLPLRFDPKYLPLVLDLAEASHVLSCCCLHYFLSASGYTDKILKFAGVTSSDIL